MLETERLIYSSTLKFVGAALITSTFVVCASALDFYVGGSIGVLDQLRSANAGETGAFTTGNLGDGSTLDNSLFPGTRGIENEQTIFAVGVR